MTEFAAMLCSLLNTIGTPLTLTDDEKQQLYNKYRMVPLVHDITAYTKRLEELRAKGYKDWEIDA